MTYVLNHLTYHQNSGLECAVVKEFNSLETAKRYCIDHAKKIRLDLFAYIPNTFYKRFEQLDKEDFEHAVFGGSLNTWYTIKEVG